MSEKKPDASEELDAIKAVYGITPACADLSRKEVTSLLNRELVRCKLERKNAYSYWAHEVEVYDERKGSSTWVDFMQFEPAWHHTATHPGCIENGTFTCYEVKSCLADIKSGHGLNFHGDENYLVMPCEVYPQFKRAYHGTPQKNFEDRDAKLRGLMPSFASFKFMLYGRAKNGSRVFRTEKDAFLRACRTKPASELLLCMMRAMIANSDRSDVSHRIEERIMSTKVIKKTYCDMCGAEIDTSDGWTLRNSVLSGGHHSYNVPVCEHNPAYDEDKQDGIVQMPLDLCPECAWRAVRINMEVIPTDNGRSCKRVFTWRD